MHFQRKAKFVPSKNFVLEIYKIYKHIQIYKFVTLESYICTSQKVIKVIENLGQRVGEVGGDSRDGSTRGRIAEERDVTWAKLVRKDAPKARSNQPSCLVLAAKRQTVSCLVASIARP